ncbi:MAG: hypothetical protein CSB46_07885 [Micrococcales bacterium]|nr:MAG: hypothetical protein CSB46_07885 [Micrococcales bacterium]
MTVEAENAEFPNASESGRRASGRGRHRQGGGRHRPDGPGRHRPDSDGASRRALFLGGAGLLAAGAAGGRIIGQPGDTENAAIEALSAADRDQSFARAGGLTQARNSSVPEPARCVEPRQPVTRSRRGASPGKPQPSTGTDPAKPSAAAGTPAAPGSLPSGQASGTTQPGRTAGPAMPADRPTGAPTAGPSAGPSSPGASTGPGKAPTVSSGNFEDGRFSAAVAAATQTATLFGAAGPLSEGEAMNHLLRRATFGATDADRQRLEELGIDQWLAEQLSAELGAGQGAEVKQTLTPYGTDIATVVASVPKNERYQYQVEYAMSVLGRQTWSERQLFEVVADVFSNLLHVTIPSSGVWSAAGDYHETVIRQHAYGRYSDMLVAAMRHPAMLRYLNNDQSSRDKLNENLGRELLELHSVGVAAGYTEDDVLQSARVLTGRTIESEEHTFQYVPDRHYVGPVTVMEWSSVARKLAVRFVADAPSEELVSRLAQVYLDNDTQIPPVLAALFSDTEFWSSVGAKTKRPVEDMVSTLRALGIAPGNKDAMKALYYRLESMGQRPLAWPAPNGYPDVLNAWLSAGSILNRFTAHRILAHGAIKDLPGPTEELMPQAEEALDAWVDRVTVALTGLQFPAEPRSVLVDYAQSSIGTKNSADARERGAASTLALILHSPYFQIR